MLITTSPSTTMAGGYRKSYMISDCHRQHSPLLLVQCSSDSKSRGGFGRQSNTKKDNTENKMTTPREEEDVVFEKRKPYRKQSSTVNRAPGLSFGMDKKLGTTSTDLQFEQRLEAIKRSALEQKKFGGNKEYGVIDYDAPLEMDPSTSGLGTKIGIGVAVVIFGFVFALGDFLPTASEKASIVDGELSTEEKQTLQTSLKQFEAAITASPRDPTAVEGAAVTLAELGEYSQASSLLGDLTKMKPNDPNAFRLLGEVQFKLKDYEGSAAAYKRSAMVSKTVDFEVLRGLTNALLAAKRPDEAVQVLLASLERLNAKKLIDGSTLEAEMQAVDPVQVELLLGKAYSDWGHVSDAVSVYDQLISTHPDDFRGYLAKGIILKENGRAGDAERMFIQARFFAPEKAKALVDRYARK